MKIERKITRFDNPAEAEEAVRLHYASMTPQQRLDEMVAMLNRWGKWNERGLERVARFVDRTELSSLSSVAMQFPFIHVHG